MAVVWSDGRKDKNIVRFLFLPAFCSIFFGSAICQVLTNESKFKTGMNHGDYFQFPTRKPQRNLI